MRSQVRRHVPKVGLLLLLTAALTTAIAQKTTLKGVWMGWAEEQVTPIVELFESQHPDIDLQLERIPFGEIFQTLEVRLAPRTGDPDIFIVDGPLTASYASRGHLLDLTDILADAMDGYTEAAIRQGTYEGRLFSEPIASSMILLFYNKKLFEEAGIEFPSMDPNDRWTWDQVVEAAEKIAKPERNLWGFGIEQSVQPYQILPFPQSMGAQVISEDGLKAGGYVDSQPFIDAIQFYQNLFTTWKVSPPGVFEAAVSQEMFGTGNMGMLLGATWNIADFAKRYPDLEFGVAPHPYFSQGEPVTPTGSWHVGINPRTKNLEAATTFIDFLAQDSTMELWFKLRGYPPVRKAVYNAFPEVFDTPEWQLVQYEMANTAVPRPKTPGYREYEDILSKALRDIQLGADVPQTLKVAAQDIDQALNKYR